MFAVNVVSLKKKIPVGLTKFFYRLLIYCYLLVIYFVFVAYFLLSMRTQLNVKVGGDAWVVNELLQADETFGVMD